MEVRRDWYQTDSDIVVNLLTKNLKKEDVNVEFGEKKLKVKAVLSDGSNYELDLDLASDVNQGACSWKVLSTKIEIKLRKGSGGKWADLEAAKAKEEVKPSYPSASKKDWDKVEKEIAGQVEEEGDVNSLFSKIYSSGDDNMKKAMIKSLQESGGTVLSTNWEEVGKKKVEVSPPDGMEFKKWDA